MSKVEDEQLTNGHSQDTTENRKEEIKNSEKEKIENLMKSFEMILQQFQEKFDSKLKEEKLKTLEKKFEMIRRAFNKKENIEEDLRDELKEQQEQNKLLLQENRLLTSQTVSTLNSQFDTTSSIKLENQLETVTKEYEEYKEKTEKELEQKNQEHEALKTKMANWKEKVKEITAKDAKKIEALKKIVSEKEEIISNFEKLTPDIEYTILEHVKYQNENWCLIEYNQQPGKKCWVNNVPVDSLPDTLQDALEDQYHQEIEKFQLENSKLKKDFQEKEEELSKYKIRALAALKKKTDELNEEKETNDKVRLELENAIENMKKEIEDLKEKNIEYSNQVESLLEFQSKSIELTDQLDESEEKYRNLSDEIDRLKSEKEQEIQNLQDEIQLINQNYEKQIEKLQEEKQELDDECKRNIKNSSEKNRKILQQYERENSRLQKLLSEKEDLLAKSSEMNEQKTEIQNIEPKEPVEDENNKFLLMAQMQANRDQEIFNMQQTIQELESQLQKLTNVTNELAEERKKNQRFEQRENANLEYLKNILVKFLSTNDMKVQKNLLPAISTVLAFSDEEKNVIEKKFVTSSNSTSYWSPITQIVKKT